MPARTIGLSDDAYRRLEALKRPGESFSDLVRRLTGAGLLLGLAETMDRDTARHYRRSIQKGRRRADRERRGRVKAMVR